ncbi:MAG: DUF417 family protein [Helicobacter sp.]|nr:DUF417 family protein [Helicobacter sp.]
MKNLSLRFSNSNFDILFLRFGAFLILLFFGVSKFFEFEVQGLVPLLSKTYFNIFYHILGHHYTSYMLGIVEAIAYLGLLLGLFYPRIGAIGALFTILTGLGTLSLMIQTGFSAFIVKDLLLIGAGLAVLKHDLNRIKR